MNVSSYNYDINLCEAYLNALGKVPVKFVCVRLQDKLVKKETTVFHMNAEHHGNDKQKWLSLEQAIHASV